MERPAAPLLFPTPPERLVDAQGRPYFLWDVETVDLAGFRERLRDPDPATRAYWMAKLMRQARPDDVFTFLSWADIERDWERIETHLGRSRRFWAWLRLARPVRR